ncbi:hypothetical protein ACHAL6_10775 [Proteiniclasticum sp. C24MP]|uniref:hypothetical protein n=1 Tax=Proteiniclasticum sp. C24MP TaxID=3374101 RepID=UPI0037546E61
MEYKYQTIREIIEKYEEDHIMDALDFMHLEFEEDATLEELISILEDGLKQYGIELFYMLSHEDMVHLSEMKKNHGRFTFEDEKDLEAGPPEELMEIIGLIDLCLVYPEMDDEDMNLVAVHVSKEFMDLFEDFLVPERLSMAGYLDEAAKIIKGALYYYGALELEKLHEIVMKNHGNMDRKLFNRVLSYRHSLTHEYESVYLEDKEYIVDMDFANFYEIEDTLSWNRGQGYKEFERPDFLDAADPLFVEREEEYEEIHNYFFDKFVVNEEVKEKYPHIPDGFYYAYFIEMLLDLGRKSQETDEIVEAFLEEMNFASEQERVQGRKLVIDYLNKISRWDNLGFANDEMPKLKLDNQNVVHMKAYMGKKKK